MLTQPTKFGPYLLLERISLGGMAEVFKAIEFGIEGFERTVAVKRILPHVAEDEEFIAMFKDEAHIAVQLQHGNIAQIYSLGHEEDSFYIALEYVAGRDVRTMFERCRKQKTVVPLAQTCFIIMKVCEGLDYAHNKKDKYGRPLNIIHRDVSPPNILVSYEGAVKLCDFGVAKAAGRVSQTQAGILKGKFGYMSPEQVRGHALDRRSDVFSAGVCLWEMLTGQRLFHGESDFATLEKVRSGEVQPPRELNSEIPAELEVIVLKALAPNPHDRFQSAAELHDRLQGFLFNQGLFYSRKDLAGWMRVHYAQDIEGEKIREQQRAGIVKEFKGKQQQSEGASPLRSGSESRSNSTGVGAKPPPPPPSGAASASDSSVPVRRSMAPTLANVSASANLPPVPRNRPAPPQPRGRAKTLLSTALAPGIITPPAQPVVPPASNSAGGGQARSGADDRPSSSSRKRSAGAQALADLNSIPTPVSTPKPFSGPQKSANLEWDDDELETHLFAQKGEKEAEVQPEVPAKLASPIVRGKPSKRSSSRSSGVDNKIIDPVDPALRLPKPFTSSSTSNTSPALSSKLPPPVSSSRTSDPIDDPASLFSIPPEIRGENRLSQTGTNAPQSLELNPSTTSLSSLSEGRVQLGTADLHSDFSARSSGLFALEEGGANSWKKWTAVGGIVLLLGLAFMVINPFSNGSAAEDAKAKQAVITKKQVGTLQLTVSPSASKVLVDGRPYPGGASRTVDRLKPGAHELMVSAGPDYLQQEQKVQIEAGKIVKSQVILQPRNITLVGTVTPSSGRVVLISGQEETELGTGKFNHSIRREPGMAYSIRVEADGHKPKLQSLEFSEKSQIELSIELEVDPSQSSRNNVGARPSNRVATAEEQIDRLPSPTPTSQPPRPTPPKPTAEKTAGLKIGTEPGLPPATVYLNGRVVSQRTPVLIEVRPGSYKIEWEWENGKRSSKRISVKDGQTALVKGDY